ncbi:fibrous sheath-interacting protein 1 [Thalassophryne amazonica]|uniref:fibrous sheath-interacting protein 1 n=1 Tax=Thalassophryne amazonica TaxID=390379 RepID=UPI001470AA5C|nr:fibrous sheath-interacting protein 1 [Thalassophryne amazonica]
MAVTDEKGDDYKYQRAIEEIIRLDEILSAKMCREKQLKHQTKELKEKLWQEFLQHKAKAYSVCDQEASNTRLFLSLEAPPGLEKEDVSVPLFETQVLDYEHDDKIRHTEKSETSPDSMIKSAEGGHEQSGEGQLDGGNSKKKQKNFVKRNIELMNAEGGQVLMTQAEKDRLAELLREIDKEEEESAKGADSKEDMSAVSALMGEGYTPEPSELEQLIDIDIRIRHLIPAEEFLTVQSSFTSLNMFQGIKVGWRCDGDTQPGEKVLQDIRERRGQERRLKEIQQQLEILGQVQDVTNDPLTEEQLCKLLDECELTESWV